MLGYDELVTTVSFKISDNLDGTLFDGGCRNAAEVVVDYMLNQFNLELKRLRRNIEHDLDEK